MVSPSVKPKPAIGLMLGVAIGLLASAQSLHANPEEYFGTQVRPLLQQQCVKCHGGEKTKGGLKLTSRQGLLQGGDSGPPVSPGKRNNALFPSKFARIATVGRIPAASTSAVTCAASPRAFQGACLECVRRSETGDSTSGD